MIGSFVGVERLMEKSLDFRVERLIDVLIVTGFINGVIMTGGVTEGVAGEGGIGVIEE
jgi:hypothetical protein